MNKHYNQPSSYKTNIVNHTCTNNKNYFWLGEQLFLLTVTHALITSKLDYCNALWVELLLKTTQKLQLVQNATTHAELCTSRFA